MTSITFRIDATMNNRVFRNKFKQYFTEIISTLRLFDKNLNMTISELIGYIKMTLHMRLRNMQISFKFEQIEDNCLDFYIPLNDKNEQLNESDLLEEKAFISYFVGQLNEIASKLSIVTADEHTLTCTCGSTTEILGIHFHIA